MEDVAYVFVNENVAELFNCGICYSVAKDPQQLLCCGAQFCKECIEAALQSDSSRGRRCPHCRKPGAQPHPDLAQQQKINKLKVRCTHQGCDWVVDFSDLRLHVAKPHPVTPPPPRLLNETSSDTVQPAPQLQAAVGETIRRELTTQPLMATDQQRHFSFIERIRDLVELYSSGQQRQTPPVNEARPMASEQSHQPPHVAVQLNRLQQPMPLPTEHLHQQWARAPSSVNEPTSAARPGSPLRLHIRQPIPYGTEDEYDPHSLPPPMFQLQATNPGELEGAVIANNNLRQRFEEVEEDPHQFVEYDIPWFPDVHPSKITKHL